MPSFGWWMAKGVLSAAYWTIATYLIAPMLFGDRLGADGAIMSGPPVWVLWAAIIGTVLLYALLSRAWNRMLIRRS